MPTSETVDFVIFACPRTGSNHLCSTLTNISGIVCHHEIFHPDAAHLAKVAHAKGAAANEAIKSVGRRYDSQTRNKDPWLFLAELKAATNEMKVGFKIFPHQPDPTEAVAHKLCSMQALQKIVLYRSNILAAFSSLKIANRSNIYFRETNDRTTGTTIPLAAFDASEFEKYASDYARWYRDIMRRIIEARSTFFFMPYEMLNSKEMLLALAAWIGVHDVSVPAVTGHVKTGTIDIAARFENGADVLAFLESTSRMDWRYDTAATG